MSVFFSSKHVHIAQDFVAKSLVRSLSSLVQEVQQQRPCENMSLKQILHRVKPITFQPSEFQLTDRGAVAIVEINVLALQNA